MNENWISIVDYARQFSISDMTVRRRIRTGKINAELRNGKYYIPRSEVEKKKKQKKSDPFTTSHEAPRTGVRDNVLSPESRTAENRPNPFSTPSVESKLVNESFKNINLPPSQSAESQESSATSNTNVDALMTLWKESMRLSKETEYRINEHFQAKLETFQEKEKNYLLQIKQLEQKTEDLELLINILERK